MRACPGTSASSFSTTTTVSFCSKLPINPTLITSLELQNHKPSHTKCPHTVSHIQNASHVVCGRVCCTRCSNNIPLQRCVFAISPSASHLFTRLLQVLCSRFLLFVVVIVLLLFVVVVVFVVCCCYPYRFCCWFVLFDFLHCCLLRFITIILPHNITSHPTTPHHATPHHTTPHHATPHSTTPHHTTADMHASRLLDALLHTFFTIECSSRWTRYSVCTVLRWLLPPLRPQHSQVPLLPSHSATS